MLRAFIRLLVSAAVLCCALSVMAQEPRPVVLTSLTDPEGVALDYAWRYAPGDGPGRAAVDFDDSRWRPVRPALRRDEFPPDWNGIGWFRRHIVLSPALQGRRITIRFSARGAGEVYLDGKLVAQSGAAGAVPDTTGSHTDSVSVAFDGPNHVLAVRYRHPAHVVPPEGIGFQITMLDPSMPAAIARDRVVVHAMLVGVLLFLIFLHLALYGFDRKARENLFYAFEMAAFTGIILNDSRGTLVATQSMRAVFDVLSGPLPPIAIFFGLLTYYGVRVGWYPRSWKWFAAGAAALAVFGFAWAPLQVYGWMFYFAAMVAEVFRVERGGYVLRRGPVGMFLSTLALGGLFIVVQVWINLGVIASVGGISDVYVFGILAWATGMSLYLAATLGQSRIVEAENARKGEELARARELQLSMLPQALPSFPGLELAAATRTAAEVGGDYYDVREAGEGAVLVAFGDATGHGLAAGIVLTAAKALFASFDAAGSPESLLAAANGVLAAMQMRQHRMALTLARITPRDLRLASAAMPPVLLHRHAAGTVEEIGTGGLPLGTRIRTRWSESSASLDAGDTLLFASDGLAELMDGAGRQLGYDEVRRIFGDAARGTTAGDVLVSLLAAADEFRGTQPLEDDLTIVVVRVK